MDVATTADYPQQTAMAISSAASRLALYELASKAVLESDWTIGSGYLGFHYVVEAARPTLPDYSESTTYFAHNDYLQILLELGLPGLAAFLLVVVAPTAIAWRALPDLAPDGAVNVIALAAATASMAAHALVDFPFYIPVCLLMYGACAGLLDRVASAVGARRDGAVFQLSGARAQLRRAATAGLATIAMVVLAKPVAAQAAAGYAQRQWRAAHAESAAYWLKIARRIEPRDWRYHWYAGQFWFAQAVQTQSSALARRADEAFAMGFTANPREPRNLLGRIATHLRFSSLLAVPADASTLRGWADRALALAPRDPGVRTEYAALLRQLGTKP